MICKEVILLSTTSLPLVPYISNAYKNLPVVPNISEAMDAFAILGNLSPLEKELMRKSLKEYCKLDTLSMVETIKHLESITKKQEK